MVFHECVQQFPISLFQKCFSETHLLWSWVLSPQQFGVPATRVRRYSLIVKKTLAMSLVATVATPLSLFGCSTTLLGHIFWCASEELQAAWLEHMALMAGSSAPVVDPLSDGSKRRLLGYQEHSGRSVRICDLNQTAEFAGRWCELVPCLLRRCGSIWCQEHQRCLLPPEALLVMGWPTCGVSAKLRNRLSCLESPDRLPAGIRAKEIFSYAGNSIHLRVGGAVLAWLLSSFAVAR